ncbi:hypothetical protein [Natronorarus salvus]|uniref:hypothetical protein n=1 Tax=Natronorarus salvus TaxID=3117733 RepID=UPI002F26555B
MRSRSSWLPMRSADWQRMGRTTRLVLVSPLYAAIAAVTGLIGITTFVVAQNVALVRDLVVFGPLPMENRLGILVNLYPFIGDGFGTLSSILLVLTGVLTGTNIALLVYHLREHNLSLGASSGSFGGVVLGTLGAGCAACGSAVLAGFFGILGVFGISVTLPLDGMEFALAAILALVLSLHWLADGMRGATIRGCPIDIRD